MSPDWGAWAAYIGFFLALAGGSALTFPRRPWLRLSALLLLAAWATILACWAAAWISTH
jgi:hypothetical protein